MRLSEGRILTTHSGSLPRPPELTDLYARRQQGDSVDAAKIRQAGNDAVRRVVSKQVQAGIDVGNDGEQTRDGFFLYVVQRLQGLGGSWVRPTRADADRYPMFAERRRREFAARTVVNARDSMPEAVGQIVYAGTAAMAEDCAGFRAALDAAGKPFVEAFMTAPSPGMVACAMRNRHYETEERYLAALGEALGNEYHMIAESGFLLQLDCPDLALERHVTFKDRPLSEFLSFAESVVETINRAIETIPAERVRMHVCWGNYDGPHDSDVELAAILPVLLRAKVGGLVLPFANGRHAQDYHCFASRPLGDDQVLVAGVIDTLSNVIEHPRVVADRLERVAEVIGDPRRVLAGTDCGFDTAAGTGRVAPDVVWAKLATLRDGARLASRQLFDS